MFINSVPMIAYIIVRTKQMTGEQYREWKQQQECLLKGCGHKSKEIARKVLEIADNYRSKEVSL